MFFLSFKNGRRAEVIKDNSPDGADWGDYWDDVEKSFLERTIQHYKDRYGYGRFLEPIIPYMGGRVLEVGAGLAFVGRLAAIQSGRQVVALDFNHAVCVQGTRLAKTDGADVKWVQGDVFAMPFESKSFSAVMSTGLLEHFPLDVLVGMVAEMRRVGDVVVANLPQYSKLWEMNWAFRRWLGTRLDPDQRLYRVEEIRDVFRSAGFLDISIRTMRFGGLFPFMSVVAK